MANISKAVYGIKHLKMMNATDDGTYPDFKDANAYFVRFIADGTFTFNDEAPESTDIIVEDLKSPLVSLPSGLGSKGFTLETNDMSEDAYKYLQGYATGEDGWTTSTPGFELPPQAVELETLAIDQFPAKVYQWARMKVTAVKAGTIGRGGLPNFTLTFLQLANLASDGTELPGDRNKEITPAVSPTSF